MYKLDCKGSYTTTYEVTPVGYYVDIVVLPDGCREAWLYNPEYGTKMLMFGCYETDSVFKGMVLCNIKKFIDYYKRKYED